jgi:hypothetical protein
VEKLNFNLCPLTVLRLQPPAPMHVKPFTEWFIGFRIRTESQYVAIRIFDLHLVGPRIVRWGMPDSGSASAICFEEKFGITNSDPNPCSRVSLITFAQENAALYHFVFDCEGCCYEFHGRNSLLFRWRQFPGLWPAPCQISTDARRQLLFLHLSSAPTSGTPGARSHKGAGDSALPPILKRTSPAMA